MNEKERQKKSVGSSFSVVSNIQERVLLNLTQILDHFLPARLTHKS